MTSTISANPGNFFPSNPLSAPAAGAPGAPVSPASPPAASGWSAAKYTSLAASGGTLIAAFAKVLKPILGNYTGTYAPLAAAVPLVKFAVAKLAPPGTKEYTVAPENEGSMRKAKFFAIFAAYTLSGVLATEMSKRLDGGPLYVAQAAQSVFVGQVIAHLPFLLQRYVAGNEVTEREVKPMSMSELAIGVGLYGVAGAIAGGELDAAAKIVQSSGREPSVVNSLIPYEAAIATFAGLTVYAPKHIQDLRARAAANAQTPPSDPAAQELDDDATDVIVFHSAPEAVESPTPPGIHDSPEVELKEIEISANGSDSVARSSV